MRNSARRNRVHGFICLALALVLAMPARAVEAVAVRPAANVTKLTKLNAHAGDVRSVAFAPDGRTLATGGEDGLVKLWNLPDGAPLRTLRWHAEAITAVRWSNDGGTVVSASLDGSVVQWNANDGKFTNILVAGAPVNSLETDAKNSIWVAGKDNGEVFWWQPGKYPQSQRLSDKSLANVIVLRGGQLLVCQDADRTLSYWRLDGNRWGATTPDALQGMNVDWEAHAALPAVRTYGGDGAGQGLWMITSTDVWQGLQAKPSPLLKLARMPDLMDGGILPLIEPGTVEPLRCLDISSDSRTLAGGTQDGQVYMWRADWLPQYLTKLTDDFKDVLPLNEVIAQALGAAPPAADVKVRGWPKLNKSPARGQNVLKLVSQNKNVIEVGLRLREDGKASGIGYDIRLDPGATVPVTLKNGTWMVYMRFAAKPAQVSKGKEDIALNGRQQVSLTFDSKFGNFDFEDVN